MLTHYVAIIVVVVPYMRWLCCVVIRELNWCTIARSLTNTLLSDKCIHAFRLLLYRHTLPCTHVHFVNDCVESSKELNQQTESVTKAMFISPEYQKKCRGFQNIAYNTRYFIISNVVFRTFCIVHILYSFILFCALT